VDAVLNVNGENAKFLPSVAQSKSEMSNRPKSVSIFAHELVLPPVYARIDYSPEDTAGRVGISAKVNE
jgi:hypothetical protein